MKTLVSTFLADPKGGALAPIVEPLGRGYAPGIGPKLPELPMRGFYLSTHEIPDEPLSLLIDEHVAVKADGLILDFELGSIGLLHFLKSPASAASSHETGGTSAAHTICQQINTKLEDAAHLRHVLGLKRLDAREPARVQLPTIEIVFLAHEQGTADTSLKSALRHSLRDALKDSGLLHSISVNLGFLSVTPNSPETLEADQAVLRRAFSWLLTSTRAWFKELALSRPVVPLKPWDTLKLTDFRRPGARVWRKSDGVQLHLIHGPNGSGKSTLAEGFAYAATGDSSRLPEATSDAATKDRLIPLIYARSTSRVAQASILKGDSLIEERAVPPAANHARRSLLPPAALLLDQSLCDKLASSTPNERARVWLKTFFFELDTERTTRRDISQSLQQQLKALTPELDDDATTTLLAKLQTLASQSYTSAKEPPSLNDFATLLYPPRTANPSSTAVTPPDFDTPGVLGQKIPRPSLDTPSDQIPWNADERAELTKRLQIAFEADVRKLELWRPHVTDALKDLLNRLGADPYETQDRAPSLDETERARRFNRWLHLVARVDLLDRALVIARVRDTLATGASETLTDLADLAPRLSGPEITQQLNEAKRERDALRIELASLTALRADTVMGRRSRQVEVRELTPLLDAIRAGFFLPRLQAADAARLEEIVGQRRPQSLVELPVGTPGWSEPLLNLFDARGQATTSLNSPLYAPESRTPQPLAKFAGRAQALVTLVSDAVRLAGLDASSALTFFDQVSDGRFRDAVDEFTAFLTPARWAYEPIKTTLQFSITAPSDKDSFALDSHGQNVARVLNTAELNTLALALYLLCAPRVPNPWRIVFLDDPLQNMDELTVATVSRSFARLLRLWRDESLGLGDWQLVLLLHGEDDCERILLECPAAHYRLPWLAPHHGTTQVANPDKPESIVANPNTSTVGGAMIDLRRFIA